MSRTDKDAPWWVRVEWWEPTHYNCPIGIPYHILWFRFDLKMRCDLPASPVREHPGRQRRWLQRYEWPCMWEPRDPDESHRYRFTWGPRPIDRRLCYWKPDRARVHAACDRARKEYNTFGQTEVEVPMFQHRHAETTGGGWWD